ncbi:MAG: hypothetical protein GY832_28980 [Chloroflexi bacterium]|nr:hypothetical protein [Chloroflexota bacterium]
MEPHDMERIRKMIKVRSILFIFVLASIAMAGCKDGKKSSATDGGIGDGGTDGTDGTDGECEKGTANCACKEGDTCDDGLTCVDGICKSQSSDGLSISDPLARSCEVLVEENDIRVVGLTKDETKIKATFVRQAPKVAITFYALKDAAIADGTLGIRYTGGGSMAIKKTSCADAKGKILTGATVTISK